MVAAGFAVGSHGRSHQSLVELGGRSLAEEIQGSRHTLEEVRHDERG